MPNFKITAWPVDEAEREYDPTWECTIEVETIGVAHAEGTRLFNEQCPELDHSKYILHANTP
ncbi:MAG: hypothetical protein WAW61_09825 [Methylococcaceae bacterium]